MKEPNYQNKIFSLLKELKKKYPSYSIGRHISSCLPNDDLWGITDKELYYQLKKYALSLSLDEEINNNLSIDDIIKDAETMFDEKDDFSDLEDLNY